MTDTVTLPGRFEDLAPLVAGLTALHGATVAYEILCLMAEAL